MTKGEEILRNYSLSINDQYPFAFGLFRVELDEDNNVEDLTVLYCNEALAKLYGFGKEYFIGHRYLERVPNSSRKWLPKFYAAAYEGQVIAFDDISDDVGRYLHLEIFPMNEKGCCVCVVHNIQDEVLEKEKKNKELKETIEALERERKLNHQVQLYAASMGLVYPLAISLDYLNNHYHMIEYDNFLNKTAKWDGTVDELIEAGASTIPEKAYAEKFKSLFGRKEALEAFQKGIKELTLKHPQYGDDGKIHWMETKVICLEYSEKKAEAISVSKVIDEEKIINDINMILNALIVDYDEVYYCDLDNDLLTVLKATDQALVNHNGKYSEIGKLYFKDKVIVETSPDMLEKLSRKNLKEYLQNHSDLSIRYQIKPDSLGRSYLETRFVHVDSGEGFKVVIGTHFVDDIVNERNERERKEREQQLQLKETYDRLDEIRDILAASEMGTWHIALVDGKEPRMYADEQMHKLLGIDGQDLSEEETYSAWFDHIEPEVVQDVLDCVQRMEDGERDEVTYPWNHPTLGRRYVRCGGTAQPIEGGYLLRGYHYDVTEDVEEQKKQDQALKDALMVAKHATRAKSTFLSNMSHDIRTPMNAIIGFTALAQTHLDQQDLVKDYLSKIHTSSTHLLSLINEILDMSRIESGTVKLEEKPVHIPDVLHDLRTMIQGQVLSKQQNLYIDTLDIKHEDIITDKLRLNQILLNLVSNAIKYTSIGGNIMIRVTELPSPIKRHTRYEFRVKDNGIGMSEEFVEHVFDSFSRERTSTISGVQGTGLGMSITKSIVDMMNGTITVESELGVGTEFVVTVDFELANETVDHSLIPELLGARALIVDDDINTCQSVSKMLREIEMRPDWSTSGKEAIIRAKEAYEIADEYKVFIIDYLMPDMNGIEAVRQVRRVIGDEIPIIVLTAYDWSDFEEEARRAGVTAFVSKPIFMSELKSVLTRRKDTEEETERTYDYHGKRVLLVEDNELNREIACAILKDTGMEVDTAVDGTEAVNIMYKADEDEYDLIFMDVQMPRMDGYTATREIRTLTNNKKANIPIVAMTANAFEEDKKKAFEAGMNAHIAKPISIKQISKVLDDIF